MERDLASLYRELLDDPKEATVSTRPIPEINKDRAHLLMKKVREDHNGCWIWQGVIRGKGHRAYGNISIDAHWYKAHRVFYTMLVGPIPAGLSVCHKCDVMACLNPAHLFLGTNADNTRDSYEKGRHRAHYQKSITHCPKGHPYIGRNLIIEKHGDYECRRCRICKNEASDRRKKTPEGREKENFLRREKTRLARKAGNGIHL